MKVEWNRNAQEVTTLKVKPVDIDGGVIIFVDTGDRKSTRLNSSHSLTF